MQTKIIAIGGQHIPKNSSSRKRSAIDQAILSSKKKKPKVLFIPTASSDDLGYCRSVAKHFSKFGCQVDALLLLQKTLSKKDIQKMIRLADVIYVGGGNTLKMMKRWRHIGVDRWIKQAHRSGTVLCGISAGSICWFESGHSDSIYYYNKKSWDYIRVRGLNLLKGIHCPHFDNHTGGRKRRSDFVRFMKTHGGIGIAIDNACAIEYLDDSYRVVANKKKANAYRVYWRRGQLFEEVLMKDNKLRPTSSLHDLKRSVSELMLF